MIYIFYRYRQKRPKIQVIVTIIVKLLTEVLLIAECKRKNIIRQMMTFAGIDPGTIGLGDGRPIQ